MLSLAFVAVARKLSRLAYPPKKLSILAEGRRKSVSEQVWDLCEQALEDQGRAQSKLGRARTWAESWLKTERSFIPTS